MGVLVCPEADVTAATPAPGGSWHVVLDVGGTTLRIGRYESATDSLSSMRRVDTDGRVGHPGDTVPALQERVLAQIATEVAITREANADRPPEQVGIAFAGPVTAEGVVTAAPTIWGRTGPPLDLARRLAERLDVPVVVVNDISAAAWRYADVVDEPFCLLTVSSGIGNKVLHAGALMVDADGHGGELGHWRCDLSPAAPQCECGGRGHLGALASGRAMEAAARQAAMRDPAAFAVSWLAALSSWEPSQIGNAALVAAIRAGDGFATDVLRNGLTYLASAISALFTAVGVRRYIIIGGFAVAVGTRYTELLADELERQGCFGLPGEQIRRMVMLGESDDMHGLIGVGRLMSRSSSALRPAMAVVS
jgi:predicted NBD/HSP70 family sugar kinase